MTMYLPLQPDGTPPEGAVPDSPRYERVLKTELPAAYRFPVAGAGLALIAAGALVMVGGEPWGIFGMIAGGGAVLAGVTGGARHDQYRRSPNGTFVKATPAYEEQETYASLVKQGTLPVWVRAAAGLAGTLMAVLVLSGLFDSPLHADELKMLAFVGALVIGLLYVAITGRSVTRNHEPPLPPRFRELADPTRPLPPEVFARDARGGQDRAPPLEGA
jgi:hypothetical protein